MSTSNSQYYQDNGGWGGDLEGEYDDFENLLKSHNFEFYDCGSFRMVYARDNIVIKIPINGDGLMDNMVEAKAWKRYRNRPTRTGIYVAPCRLLENGCLMMVKVETDFEDPLPDWATKIDHLQVGLYQGRMVAYDFALDLPERARWEKEWGKFSEFFYSAEWLDDAKRKHLKSCIKYK